MSKRTIGENLRELRAAKAEREERKITQAELAAVMGVEKNTVWKWEHDKVQLSSDQIVRLADYYGVSADELLRGGKAKNLVMMNETGLSDQTIDRLRGYKAKGKTELSKMINLLCDARFSPHKLLPASGELLLSALYAFVHCEDHPVFDDTETGGHYIGSQADLYQLRIIQELQQLRADYQQTRAQAPDQEQETVSYTLHKIPF